MRAATLGSLSRRVAASESLILDALRPKTDGILCIEVRALRSIERRAVISDEGRTFWSDAEAAERNRSLRLDTVNLEVEEERRCGTEEGLERVGRCGGAMADWVGMRELMSLSRSSAAC